MKSVIIVLLVLGVCSGASAAGGGYHLDSANIDLTNQASLQNGAKLFVNYCMGCHSAEHQRYNRFARDAGLSDEQVDRLVEFLIVLPGVTADE